MEIFTGGKPFIELSRAELLKIKNQEAFIPIIYAHIVGLIKAKYGNERTMARLREMGHNLAEGLLKYWSPSNIGSVRDIIRETYKFMLYRNIHVKEGPQEINIRDFNCPVCYFDIANSDIPFCIVISGLIEHLVNLLRTKNPKLPKIECNPLASRSMGAPYCEHIIKIK
ncbi:MAG: hypothetical protein LUQ65_09775 [Candidatus Helarchaeota archaeon]|nr:hypothetical protein [Candidatus Helarchaeota archaeon]